MFNADQRGFKRAVDCRSPFFFFFCRLSMLSVHPRLLFVFKLSLVRIKNSGPCLSHIGREKYLHASLCILYDTSITHQHLRYRTSRLAFFSHFCNFFTIRSRSKGKWLISFHCRISVDPPLFLYLCCFVFFMSDGNKGRCRAVALHD